MGTEKQKNEEMEFAFGWRSNCILSNARNN